MHQKRTAKFVRQYAQLADIAVAAVEQFFGDTQRGEFPGEAETHHMPEESQEIMQRSARWPMSSPAPAWSSTPSWQTRPWSSRPHTRTQGSQVPPPVHVPAPARLNPGFDGVAASNKKRPPEGGRFRARRFSS